MPNGSHDKLLLPVGQALVSSSAASQRDLVEILARARSMDLYGLLSIRTSIWNGHMLLVEGVPLYAHATRDGSETPLLDRDAYEHLCLAFGVEAACEVHLYRLDERATRALPGLFQRCALVRRLSSASELRFLLEIVGGCHFDGCLQVHAGEERAIVLVHQGRPLGSYTANARQIQTSLSGSLASILGKPNPEVAFFPTPYREPAPLPSGEVFRPAAAGSPEAAARHARMATVRAPAPSSAAAPIPFEASPVPRANAPDAVPFRPLGSHQRPEHDEAAEAPPRGGERSLPARDTRPAPALRQVPSPPQPSARDDLAESQMLWLLTALDREWGQLKEKGLTDATTLTSLAGMTSLCLAKVEGVRTGLHDVPADPATVEGVVEQVRSRFPSVSALRAHGSRIDAGPLVATFRSLNSRTAEREWLVRCSAALVIGLRLALAKLVEQCESELTREEMQQTCDVYLADVEADLHALRTGAMAMAG